MASKWQDKYEDKLKPMGPFDVISTGIFKLDFAIGGGWAEGRMHMMSGWESSAKSTTAIRSMGEYQKKHPDKRIVYIDTENSFSPDWALTLGLDSEAENFFVYTGNVLEEMTDFCDALLTEDFETGLVVLDSLAFTTSVDELEAAGVDHVMGKKAKRQSELCSKLNTYQIEYKIKGHNLTVLVINQMRNKIGFVMGDPQIETGAKAFQFASQTMVRFKKVKEIKAKKRDLEKGEAQELGESEFTIKKNKQCPIANSGAYIVGASDGKQLGLGEINNLDSILKDAKVLGLRSGGGQAQRIHGIEEVFKSEADMKEYLIKDYEAATLLAAKVIAKARMSKKLDPLPPDMYLYKQWTEEDLEVFNSL